MTTGTATSDAPPTAARRPVPWASIGWVTLRQRRGAMIGVSAPLGLIAAYLVVMAIIQNNAYAAGYWGGSSSALQSGGAQTVSSLMFAVPVLLGAFVGALAVSVLLIAGAVALIRKRAA